MRFTRQGKRRPHDGPDARGSLEREGPGHRPNPSLCGGAAVPLGRSLWPMRGSTPRSHQVQVMHRRAAGSQRPVRTIRAVKFEVHDACAWRGMKLVCWGKRREMAATRPLGELGNRRVGWKGGFARSPRDARALGTLCPLAVGQSVRRSSTPGLVSSTGTLCHGYEPSQEMLCKFV